jgi:hypothetical protein
VTPPMRSDFAMPTALTAPLTITCEGAESGRSPKCLRRFTAMALNGAPVSTPSKAGLPLMNVRTMRWFCRERSSGSASNWALEEMLSAGREVRRANAAGCKANSSARASKNFPAEILQRDFPPPQPSPGDRVSRSKRLRSCKKPSPALHLVTRVPSLQGRRLG